MALQHLRSGTANKRPLPTAMSDGQLAVNTNLASPGLFFKDSNGDLVKAGPVHVGTTAPNASPASTAATALVANTIYQILTVGTSDFTSVGASANTVGVVFTASGTTTGTGTVSGQQGNEKGEQWLDTTNSLYVMKVYDGTGWRVTDSISLANGTAAAPSLHFGSDTNTGLFRSAADSLAITTAGTQRVTIDSSGKAGIGTSSPTAALHVSANDPAIFIQDANSVGDSVTATFQFRDSSDTQLSYLGFASASDSNFSVFNTMSGGALRFGTASSERMQIDSSGNVGIGTSSPLAKLHIGGSEGIRFGASGATAKADVKYTSSGAEFLDLSIQGTTTGHGNIRFFTGPTPDERMRLDSSGRLGLGTSSPSSWDIECKNLVVASSDHTGITIAATGSNKRSNLYFSDGTSGSEKYIGGFSYDHADDSLLVRTAATERLRIDSSGKVAIGTTTATAKLTVEDSAATKANFTHASSNKTALYIESDDTSARIGSTYYGSGGSFKPLAFLTAGSERMRIDSSGNLFIGGTTAASADIALNADGSATFNHFIQSTRFSTRGALGVNVNGTDYAFAAYDASSNLKASVDLNGAATFAGRMKVELYESSDNATIYAGVSPSNDSRNFGFALTNATNGNLISGLATNGSAEFTGVLKVNRTISGDGCFHAALNGTVNASITSAGAATFAGNLDVGANSGSSSGTGLFMQPNGQAYLFTASASDALNIYQGTNRNVFINSSGSATFAGALSKGSGSFKISHPLSAKTETHHLVHSFIEGPQADLIYRGYVDLVDGQATINIDTAGRMTEGTFEVLCTNVSCFTSNESDWIAVKGSVKGNVLTITAQDATATSKVSWMVVGERKDQHMLDTEWTDDAGRVITEPKKVIEVEEEAEE